MNLYESTTQDLSSFISKSPTSFHAVRCASDLLDQNGFSALNENEIWDLQKGHSYYTVRADSSVIAFCIPYREPDHYRIIASHSDSPSLKIKESPELEKNGHYIELNVEVYGGPLLSPWFDRPLGIAGRIITEKDGCIRPVLVDCARDMLMIPSLAIHMNRKINEGAALKIQSDLLPIFGDENAKGLFMQTIADAAHTNPQDIVGTDLFLYDRSRPSIWGANREFFSSPRLDDLQCAFSALTAITCHSSGTESVSSEETGILICCIFDHEEVGSRTRQGADSTFLNDVLERISLCLEHSRQKQLSMLSASFMLSADNAHAVHPNHTDKADLTNRPALNRGVVLKFNASQKYTTDALSAGIFRTICKKHDVPVQTYFNHSDIPGGSTLGNISLSHVSVASADIGCAQLAMHSPYETTGIKDTLFMVKAMKAFYESNIRVLGSEYEIR